MKYPKMPKDDRKNQKLTTAQHEEINHAVNVSHIGVKQLAKKYNVSTSTIRYWSNPLFKAVDKINSKASRNRALKDPVKKEKYKVLAKARYEERLISQPLLKEWLKSRKARQTYTTEQKQRKSINSVEYIDESFNSRRNYRAINYNGFRMFLKHINKVYNLNDTCHSKTAIKSTNYSKNSDVYTMKSASVMVRKLHISLQLISKTILRPIHALRRVFSHD